MIHMGVCELKIPCVDCKSEICCHAGRKEADCPFYRCPTPELDCETECEVIDEIIEKTRGEQDG